MLLKSSLVLDILISHKNYVLFVELLLCQMLSNESTLTHTHEAMYLLVGVRKYFSCVIAL